MQLTRPYLEFQSARGQTIRALPEPIGRGGEGIVYQISSPAEWRSHVVKVYHPQESKPEREEKLRYMLAHVPLVSDHLSLIWPNELVYENGQFAGFIMRRARGEYDLTILSSLKLSKRLDDAWQARFSREKAESMHNRLRICQQIASVIAGLHQSEQYVLVDIKPENIRIDWDGYTSLIDLDSLAIADQGELLYPAQKLSSEYSPPEIKNLDFKNDFIPETWDRFSMAIVFYKVLFGLHPFAGTGKGEYKALVSHEQKIQAGLFPHGSNGDKMEIVPRPHQNFGALPPALQKLFLRCFGEGLDRPEYRPSAQEWSTALQSQQLNLKAYQNPIPVPRRVVADLVNSFKLDKANLALDHQSSQIPLILLSLVNVFNLVAEDVVGGSIGVLLLVFGAGVSWLYTMKYNEEVQFDTQNKELIIKYKGVFRQKVIRKYKFDKLQATLKDKGNHKILRIYENKSMWGGGRKPIARIKVDQDINEQAFQAISQGLKKFGVRITEPGVWAM